MGPPLRDRGGAVRPREAGERLLALLQESVRLHLRSDVPVGAFLSGGLDSSAVVALSRAATRGRVRTYAVGFDGGARASCPSPGSSPSARLRAPRGARRPAMISSTSLGRVVWHLDQPIADEACLASYILAERAAQDVKVVLTGEGGDELFAGYARYAGERLRPTPRAPAPLRRLASPARDRLPGLRRPKIAVRALCEPDEAARLVAWFPFSRPGRRAASPPTRATAPLRRGGRASSRPPGRADARDPLGRMLYVDTTLWLPDDLLLRGDKTSMAASLEARVPLLDHRVVEFAAALPPSLKLRGRTRKLLLREVMRPFLPPPSSRGPSGAFRCPSRPGSGTRCASGRGTCLLRRPSVAAACSIPRSWRACSTSTSADRPTTAP